MSKLIVLLLAIFAISSYGYVTDIAVDGPSTQIYVTTDSAVLFEVDSFTLTQNYFHNKTGATESRSLFVGRRNNRRALYDFVGSESGMEFVYYPVPLTHHTTLVPSKSTSLPNGLSLNSVYDQKDNIALHTVSRNLTLVDLKSMEVLDTFTQWVGSRKFGKNIVYNHNNKHVYTFYSHVPIRGVWGLSVEEHKIVDGKFEEIDTSYDCLCQEPYNATESPFYKVEFTSNGCRIDYSVSPARIWCAYIDGQKFFSFNSNNLTHFHTIDSSAPFNKVAWDFHNRVVYTISVDPDVAAGFQVSKVHLSTGAIISTYTNTELTIDFTVAELDPVESHLYIALEGVDAIVSVNTRNMATSKVITLSA